MPNDGFAGRYFCIRHCDSWLCQRPFVRRLGRIGSSPIMSKKKNPVPTEPKIILRGVHLRLTAALRNIAEEKVARLLRHEHHLIRVRLYLEHDQTRRPEQAFIAKGHLEIRGPDLVASVATEDLYKSIDELVDKLDRMLRRRVTSAKEKRHHPHPVELAVDLPKVD